MVKISHMWFSVLVVTAGTTIVIIWSMAGGRVQHSGRMLDIDDLMVNWKEVLNVRNDSDSYSLNEARHLSNSSDFHRQTGKCFSETQ